MNDLFLCNKRDDPQYVFERVYMLQLVGRGIGQNVLIEAPWRRVYPNWGEFLLDWRRV